MKKYLTITTILILLLITTITQAALSIYSIAIVPNPISLGGEVLLTCQVTHSDGPANIARVAATISIGNSNSSYPMLYDDGTNGDKVAEDGIYSLEISAGETSGEAKIIFIAVDTEQNEVESAPVILTVQ